MKEERKQTIRIGTKIGAAMGSIVFLVFGIVPGFYLGSYGALMLLGRLAGGPLEPTTMVRMATVAGILLSVLCIGTAFMLLGSVLGATLAYITDLLATPGRTREAKEARAHN